MNEARMNEIRENYLRTAEKVKSAAEKRSSGQGEVTLLAATKTVPAEEILYARELGLSVIGENRAEELNLKYDELKGSFDIHLIGSLQTRKVRSVIGKVSLIHSLDRISLAREIDLRSKAEGIISDVLVEINSGREENKGGIMPEDADAFLDSVGEFENLRCRGIMTMAPICEKKSEYRKYFQETYRIFIDIYQRKMHNIIEPVLSMGMSDSYEEAILEGATLVRVGSGIFGRRK